MVDAATCRCRRRSCRRLIRFHLPPQRRLHVPPTKPPTELLGRSCRGLRRRLNDYLTVPRRFYGLQLFVDRQRRRC